MNQTLAKRLERNKVQDNKNEARAPRLGVWDYFEGIKAEFRKITWTEKSELKSYTKIVVGASFVFGMGIYFADVVIQRTLAGLNTIVQWIAG